MKNEELPYLDNFITDLKDMNGDPYISTLTITGGSENYVCHATTNANATIPYVISSSSNTTIINNQSTGTTPYTSAHLTGGYIPAIWHDNTTSAIKEPTHITIHDEHGNLKYLSIAEVSRYYGEALEYRRIKRFAKLFPIVREMLNELLIAIKLADPHDDDELDRLEAERKKK